MYTEMLLLDAHPSYISSYETRSAGKRIVQTTKMGITDLLICFSRASDTLTRQLSAG